MPDPSNEDLRTLIELAQGGDRQARDRLLDHAYGRFLKLTRKMLSGFPKVRRWEETDDVCNKVMLRMHRALQTVRLESPRHFFNLAGTQIRQELISLKRHYYGPRGLGTNHHTDRQPADDAGGTLVERSGKREVLAGWGDLHELFELLPSQSQEILELLVYQGMTQQEAADELGVALSTVKRRWQDARVRFDDLLRRSS